MTASKTRQSERLERSELEVDEVMLNGCRKEQQRQCTVPVNRGAHPPGNRTALHVEALALGHVAEGGEGSFDPGARLRARCAGLRG